MLDKKIQKISIEGNNNIVIQMSSDEIFKLNLKNKDDMILINNNKFLSNIFSTMQTDKAINNSFFNFKLKSVISINKFGNSSKFMKHKNIIKLQALKDNVCNFHGVFHCDGKLEKLKVYPQVIEKVKYEESILVLQYKTPKLLKKGDIINHDFSFNCINSFNNKKEYWIIDPISPTDSYTIKFISPVNKLFTTVYGYVKYNHIHENICDIQPKITPYKDNQRNCIIWKINKLDSSVKYKLEWTW